MDWLDEAYAARARISPFIVRTPTVAVRAAAAAAATRAKLHLKLECLQVTGSFKPRGAFNAVRSAGGAAGLVTSSGGNHGIATAYVGHVLGIPTEIPLPANVHKDKLAAMKALGAEAMVAGPNFHVSNARAQEIARDKDYLYLHPFATKEGIAGQGTIGLEILEDAPEVETIVVAVGGGGLLGGVAAVVKSLRSDVRIVGVEPTGANVMIRSLAAGQPVTLDRIDTKAATLAPPMTSALNLALAQDYVDEMVEVTDEEMIGGARWLWRHCFVATEMAGAATAAALLTGKIGVRPDERVCLITCGAGTAGLSDQEAAVAPRSANTAADLQDRAR